MAQKMAESWMARALELAQKPRVDPLPNPRVGAVLVHQNKLIAEGFHRGPGSKHAEVVCLEAARRKDFRHWKSAELFVNLEPCCHTEKRTPPCVPALLESGVRKIIIAHLDPNPAVKAKGIRALRRAGVDVQVGLLRKEAEAINQAFIKNQTEHLPYVVMKLALSFDGKMADDRGHSQWITGAKARKKVHALRERIQCLGIGSGTIDKDLPRLSIRTGKKEKTGRLIIFGNPSRTDAPCFELHQNPRPLVLPRSELRTQLKRLYENHQISQLLIEGGPTLASEFLKLNLVDELHLFFGRGFIGGKGLFSLGRDWPLSSLETCVSFAPEELELLDRDIYTKGLLHVYRAH